MKLTEQELDLVFEALDFYLDAVNNAIKHAQDEDEEEVNQILRTQLKELMAKVKMA